MGSSSKQYFLIPMIILLSVLTAKGASRTYYVSPSGSDANSGLTITKPFRSINAAIGQSAADDTVYVLPGTYQEVIAFSGKKGFPEHPICLMGYSTTPDEYPVIDGGAVGPSSTSQCDWMRIRNSHWIEIARLKFKNGWTFPIKAVGSSYLTFRSCMFWGGKRVINASDSLTHHILVEDCYWDQGGEYLWKIETDSGGAAAWTSMHHGAMAYFNGSLIDFHGTGGSMVIRRNTMVNGFQAVRYRGVKGFDSNVEIYENHVSNMRDNDFEPEYYTYNLHIYHNTSHNIHKTLSVDNVEGGQIYYYGNVVTADTDAWSMNIASGVWKIYARPNRLSYPLYAFNNSFYVPGTAFFSMSGKPVLLKHYNNAYFFLKNGGWDLNLWDESDEFDYDISNKPWSLNLTSHHQEVHGILGEVQYTDPSQGNFALKPGSKGIDAGKVMSFKEFGWTQAYQGTAPDMGAYEGNHLVEGPPFRYMKSPEGRPLYNEKPRIVRHYVDGNRITIYFSDRINPGSVRKDDVALFEGERALNTGSVSFPRTEYEMVIETTMITDPSALSLAFKRLPKGMNGETATTWASAMKIHKTTKR